MIDQLPVYPSDRLQVVKGGTCVFFPNNDRLYTWICDEYPLSRTTVIKGEIYFIEVHENKDPFWTQRRVITHIRVFQQVRELYIIVREIAGGFLDNGPRYTVPDFMDGTKSMGTIAGYDAALALAYLLVDKKVPRSLDAEIDPGLVTWLKSML